MIRPERQPVHHKKNLRRSAETGPAADGFDVNDLVGIYFSQLEHLPLLTQPEEYVLMSRMKKGKDARIELAATYEKITPQHKAKLQHIIEDAFVARDEMIERNQLLVVSIAKKYEGRGLDLIDLISEGNIGLIRASKKFEPERGWKFSTYATWWIQQVVTRAIADQGRTIRIPVHVSDKLHQIIGIQRRLTQVLQRDPTDEEIAAETKDMTAKQVGYYLEKSRKIISLQAPTDEEENSELGDFIPDPEPSPTEQSTQNILREHMAHILTRLPPREALILQLRYGLNDGGFGLTLEEIGQKMGVTREWIRHLETLALTHLRHPAVRRQLEDYLDSEDANS